MRSNISYNKFEIQIQDQQSEHSKFNKSIKSLKQYLLIYKELHKVCSNIKDINNMKSNNNLQQLSYAIYVGKKSLTLTNLSTHQYAQAVELYTILGQCARIFLRKAALSPQQTVSQYLSQCNKGQHVLLKSFSSFNKSALNRICFLHNFIKIFELQNHQRNGLDYYQLFRLLCSDFPKDVIVKSVNLVIQKNEGNIEANMAKILNSRKFINALYLNFIHTEYLQALLNEVFQGKNQSVPINLVAEWVYQKEKNLYKVHDKPLFSSVIQSLLNQIRKKGVINEISSHHNFPSSMKDSNLNRKIIFVNEKNCLEYINQHFPGSSLIKNKKRLKISEKQHLNSSQEQNQQSSQKKKKIQSTESHTKVSYQQFLKQIINHVQYHKWIKQNLEMFQNSIIWAVETYKILTTKETGENIQPLNQKKMKKK